MRLERSFCFLAVEVVEAAEARLTEEHVLLRQEAVTDDPLAQVRLTRVAVDGRRWSLHQYRVRNDIIPVDYQAGTNETHQMLALL